MDQVIVRGQLTSADTKAASKFWNYAFLSDLPKSFILISPSFLELEAQVQTLLDAARVAIDSVNARGNTVAAHLQNIPARVTEVAEHGAHEGSARAIAVISTMSGADFRQ